VQLFFWYFAVVLALPDIKAHLTIPGLAFLSNRGAQLTWLFITQTGDALWYWLLGGVLISALTAWLDRRRLRAQGKLGGGFLAALTAFVIVAIIGYGVTSVTATLPDAIRFDLNRGDRGTLYVDGNNNGKYDKNIDTPMRHVPIRLLAEDGSELGQTFTNDEGAFLFFDLGEKKGASVTWQTPPPVVISQPRMQGFNLVGGLSIKPEYFGLLLGLVIYTAAFIAEIVRAGINSVPKGQWEAARALGLRQTEILRMIVLPQALRVAIPPMTSQFLNLTKNSSLAVAVGYPDMFGVSQTIVNQSGAELQVILMLMATYLFFSLTTSTFTNWYNRRVTLKER
jgi:general L-amino acid transport system permease protein